MLQLCSRMLLDYGKFLTMTFGGFLFQFAISGISFFASCVFNSTSKSLMIGAGLPALLAFNLLSGMNKKLEFLKAFSLVTLFDTKAVIDGEGYVIKFALLAAMGIILYVVGVKVA